MLWGADVEKFITWVRTLGRSLRFFGFAFSKNWAIGIVHVTRGHALPEEKKEPLLAPFVGGYRNAPEELQAVVQEVVIAPLSCLHKGPLLHIETLRGGEGPDDAVKKRTCVACRAYCWEYADGDCSSWKTQSAPSTEPTDCLHLRSVVRPHQLYGGGPKDQDHRVTCLDCGKFSWDYIDGTHSPWFPPKKEPV